MKGIKEDIANANKFPEKVSDMGFGMSQADAKLSPIQLKRLVDKGLIRMVVRVAGSFGYCGGKVNDKANRQYTTYIRN